MTFSNISAVATYPGTSISVGGGSLTHVKFPSDTVAWIMFPFNVEYQLSSDPNLTVLKDLASKCSGNGDLTVNYDLTVRLLLALRYGHH